MAPASSSTCRSRFRHSEPRPGKNIRAELALRKAALESRTKQLTAKFIDSAGPPMRTRKARLNPRRRSTKAVHDGTFSDPTFVPGTEALDTGEHTPQRNQSEEHSLRPQYTRGYLWQDSPESHESSMPLTTVTWTETLLPVPAPPSNELNNAVAWSTIISHPSLFCITTPINVTIFQHLLATHPNQDLVASVCNGLTVGFWPWANTDDPNYPITNRNSDRPLKEQSHVQFVHRQRDVEIEMGRFSESFGTELLPGMHSIPIGVVPKPRSSKLRLIADHSVGDYSPDSMIPKWEGHVHLDTLRHLGRSLIHARRKHGTDVELVVFKSDVSQAYRRLPMHVLWQIRQIITINGENHVDHYNKFGNRAAGRIWCTFFGLVLWIATFVKMLSDIFGYVDDSFSWEFANQKTWYEPYHKFLPSKQAALLTLFDELCVPHEEEKQLHGRILTIIGFDVDPNTMTITMPISSRLELIHAIRNFTLVGTRRPLRDLDSLAGWCNWSFNVYPLLRPGLSTLYAKKQGKSHPFQLVWISKALCRELLWMADHLEDMPGIRFLEALEWGVHLADITIQTDASSKGFGIWFLNLVTGFFSHAVNNADDGIFFNEALTVVSALLLALQFSSKPWRVLIYTDNMNTVDIFNSLHAKPFYNPLLITTVDALMEHHPQLRVLHISGPTNIIADALSRGNNDLLLTHYPRARLIEFTPPQLKSGSADSVTA